MKRSKKRVTPAVAAVPPTAQPLRRFEPSITGKFIRLLGRASNEEIKFLDGFIDKCNSGTEAVPRVAFNCGAGSVGLGFLNSWEDWDMESKAADLLKEAYLLIAASRSRDPVAHALTGILAYHKEQGDTMGIDDMLFFIENAVEQQDAEIETAREILKARPEALASDIREIVAKHPEIMER
ncbi:MAG TPA: hypothetical protein VN736_27665 [Candidatus Limnocylindrales bacterium]|nr:hypothetical protein [Candidatus Limnocylindrales bacterium]